jgi:flotillin
LAEKEAEIARAAKEKASREADIIVQAEIAKRRIEIDAEAESERMRLIARGEADAVFMQKEAEAKGLYEVLRKQADGFEEIVKSVGGNPRDAVLLLVADKLPELVKTQVDAIKNIKIDKVTVWEGGNQEGAGNSTSKFISGLYKSVPPMSELFNMAGMDLPGYLGSEREKAEEAMEVPDKKSNTK